jgi:beta-lactamase regulating signal transducer with metallopeptidase domain
MTDALALALVHFLWQGALLGGGLMRLGRSASVRYTIGVATLAAMLAAPILTMVLLAPVGTSIVADAQAASVGANTLAAEPVAPAPTSAARSTLAWTSIPSTWILTVWLIGVGALSARVAGGWFVARRLATSGVMPVGAELERLAAALADRLALRRRVRVLVSSRAAVPVMIGWWRPVVLFPASALSGMPLSQIEALLAHEFAHIRRHDYLVNLLQSFVETVCFYHPAVWWISREVRRERELCCDDIVVGLCDRVTYVSALAQVASLATPRLALGANGGSLRDRIQRLIDSSSDSQSAKGGWMAMLPLVLVLSIFVPQTFTAAATPTDTVATVESVQVAQATTREQQAAELERSAREARLRREMEQTERQARDRTAAEQATTTQSQRAGELELAARSQLEVQRSVEAELEVKLAQLAVEQTSRTLQRQRELVEKGLATRDNLAVAEEAVMRAELALHVAQARGDRAAQVREGVRGVAHEGIEHRPRVNALLPTATLAAGDVLDITIAEEPGLPREFTVRADGSIRFPFLGTIRVQGSTAQQVQAAIGKLIVDKGLGANPVVAVIAHGSR